MNKKSQSTTSNSIRAFVAVPISGTPALQDILGRLGMLGSAVRPVVTNNLHVTLKFLGQISVEQIPEIVAVMRDAADPETAFTARIVGLGTFPRLEHPSVVWAGLDEVDGLICMVNRLEQCLTPLGFPHERQPFHPHLTLARIRRKAPAGLSDLLRDRQATPFGSASVKTIQLFRSEPGPTGIKYRPLATAGLSSTVSRRKHS